MPTEDHVLLVASMLTLLALTALIISGASQWMRQPWLVPIITMFCFATNEIYLSDAEGLSCDSMTLDNAASNGRTLSVSLVAVAFAAVNLISPSTESSVQARALIFMMQILFFYTYACIWMGKFSSRAYVDVGIRGELRLPLSRINLWPHLAASQVALFGFMVPEENAAHTQRAVATSLLSYVLFFLGGALPRLYPESSTLRAQYVTYGLAVLAHAHAVDFLFKSIRLCFKPEKPDASKNVVYGPSSYARASWAMCALVLAHWLALPTIFIGTSSGMLSSQAAHHLLPIIDMFWLAFLPIAVHDAFLVWQ